MVSQLNLLNLGNKIIIQIMRLALFFNNLRGLEVYKTLKKKFIVDIYLSQKNLNRELLEHLKGERIIIIKKINSTIINNIKKKNYYLLITAGWPLIFPQTLYLSSSKGTINLHAGKVPKYRGGSPLNWQIINSEKKIEISVLKMTSKLDAGPVYDYKNFDLKPSHDILSVHQKVNKIFPKMVLKTIKKIKKGIKPKKQNKDNNKNFYRQRHEADGLIIWTRMDSLQVFNFVRAITLPYPGAYYYNNKNIKKKIFVCKISKLNPKIKPGTEFNLNKKLYIKCKKNSIEVIN